VGPNEVTLSVVTANVIKNVTCTWTCKRKSE